MTRRKDKHEAAEAFRKIVKIRKAAKSATGQAIERPDATPGMLAALFPDGVRPDQVRHLPRVVGALEGIARAVHGGDLLRAPWLDVAGDALAGHVDKEDSVSELDKPVSFVPVGREEMRHG